MAWLLITRPKANWRPLPAIECTAVELWHGCSLVVPGSRIVLNASRLRAVIDYGECHL